MFDSAIFTTLKPDKQPYFAQPIDNVSNTKSVQFNITTIIGTMGYDSTADQAQFTSPHTDQVSGNPAPRRIAQGSIAARRSGALEGRGGQKWLGSNFIRSITEFEKNKKWFFVIDEGVFGYSAALEGVYVGRFFHGHSQPCRLTIGGRMPISPLSGMCGVVEVGLGHVTLATVELEGDVRINGQAGSRTAGITKALKGRVVDVMSSGLTHRARKTQHPGKGREPRLLRVSPAGR